MTRFFLTVLLVAFSTPTHATPVIDQSCCTPINALFEFGDFTRAQTFTVGAPGIFTGIDLGVQPLAGVLPTFELFAGALTDGQVLASFGSPIATLALVDTGVPIPDTPPGATFFFADLSSLGLFVRPNQQFSIVQRPGPSGGFGRAGWHGAIALSDQPSPYSAGDFLSTRIESPSTLSVVGFFDGAFRTYVDSSATAVPAPSALLLVWHRSSESGLAAPLALNSRTSPQGLLRATLDWWWLSCRGVDG
jgi:hypothetical protein